MRTASAILALGFALAAQAETVRSRSPETGAESWEARSHGLRVHLTQLSPDQVRVFFLNRGFPREAVERYAAACVFMTIVRNEASPAPIAYRLVDWIVHAEGRRLAPRLKEDWMREWEAQGLSQAARIAFEWSQLPSEQRFERGDWNQGMTSYGLPPGSAFDLEFRWQAGARSRRGTLTGARCAPARD